MAKKARRPRRMGPPTVDSIINELEAKMRTGLGRKRLSRGAFTHWNRIYRESVKKRLDQGGDWEREKKNVLRVAKKLGKVAAALTDGREVQRWAAEVSAVAVKADPSCPGAGTGLWCDI